MADPAPSSPGERGNPSGPSGPSGPGSPSASSGPDSPGGPDSPASRLGRLLAVQQHDTALDQLRHRRANLPERAALAAVESEQNRLASRRAEVQRERDELAGRQTALEHEVADLEARRAGLDRRLATGTVPKELETLAHEVDTAKARIHDLEDVELDLMEAIEPLDAELADLSGQERAATDRADLLRVDVARAEEAVEAGLGREQAARDDAVAGVADDLLDRYERLRARLGGVAVARLVGGRCTGCNLMLPTSEVDRIRHEDPDTLVFCEQCGRILVR